MTQEQKMKIESLVSMIGGGKISTFKVTSDGKIHAQISYYGKRLDYDEIGVDTEKEALVAQDKMIKKWQNASIEKPKEKTDLEKVEEIKSILEEEVMPLKNGYIGHYKVVNGVVFPYITNEKDNVILESKEGASTGSGIITLFNELVKELGLGND